MIVNYDCKKRMNVIVNEEYAGGPTLGHRQLMPSQQSGEPAGSPPPSDDPRLLMRPPEAPLFKKGENEVPLRWWRETLFPGLP